MTAPALTIALAVVVGVSLGLLGGGGSILTVPLLAYVAGMEPKHAIATSLLVVGVTSAIAAIHARPRRPGPLARRGALRPGRDGRRLHRRPGGPVHSGHRAARGVRRDHDRRRAGDAARPQRQRPAPTATSGCRWSASPLLGMAVGLISGLVGAGGGFLLVPALALLAGLPMPDRGGYLACRHLDAIVRRLRRPPRQRADRLAAGGLRHRRRRRRGPARRPPHRVRQPRHVASNVRLVRPADGVGRSSPKRWIRRSAPPPRA